MNWKKQVEALKLKDESAFNAIYHETKNAVFVMAVSIVRDQSLAEDAMQQTYMKMIQRINSYNKKYKFTTWLLTIAKNTAIDVYNARQHEFSIDITEASDLFVSKDRPIEQRLEMEYYLSALSTEEKQIVLLKVVADLKHKEIAKLLNKPLGTITWKYQEAIKKMQSLERGEQL